MFSRRHLRRLTAVRASEVVVCAAALLLVLSVSSSALATRKAHGGAQRPTVAFPYSAGPAQRLTLRLVGLSAQLERGRASVATRRLVASVSRQRAGALLSLAARNPDLALRWLLPQNARRVLRGLPGAQVERRVTVSGRYRLVMNNAVTLDQIVSPDGKHAYTLRATRPPQFTADELIRVSGYRVGNVILAPSGGIRRLPSTGRSLASTTVGQVKVAVIAANYTDSSSTIDMQALQSEFEGNPGHDVDSYFAEASYGKMSVVPSFYGPFTVPETTTLGCNSSTTTQDVMQAAGGSIDFTQFRRLIFVVNCPQTLGMSSSEGPITTPSGTITAAVTLLTPGFAYSPFAIAHEISHTLGSGNRHASFYVCLPVQFIPPSRFGNSCVSDEYGDLFDVLGGGADRFISQQDPYHKANAGWFTAANYPTVTTPGTSTYTLSPYELPSDGPLALDIPRGNSGTYFTVEYRQPIGFDSWMGSQSTCPGCTVTQGASIRLVGLPDTPGDTQLIDTTPGSIPSTYFYPEDDVRDGALLPGHTFTDPEYGVSITTLSADSNGLTVQVTLPPQTCTHAAPTVSAVSPSSQAVGAGQTATYTFTLTNNDSAGCPANTFRYFSPGTDGLNFVASPDYLTLAPGASATISLGISAQPGTTAGTWGFTSTDGRGGGFIYSNTLGVGAAVTSGFSFKLTGPTDTAPPTAPSGFTAQVLGAEAVKLSWQASTDNIGVAGYTITSSSGYAFTATGTTFVDANVSPSSSYTYTIKAFDLAGNSSSAATASVTTPGRSDFTSPTPPVVTATATDHSVSVSWTPATDNVGVAYYQVTPCLLLNCTLPASVHSFTAYGIPTSTRLNLQVQAVDGDGNFSDRGSGKYTVYTGAQGTSPPSQPQRFVSTAGSYHSVALSWGTSTDDKGVAGYYVYRNSRQIATVTSTSYTDTDAGGSAAYYVQAFDADGSLSAPSTAVWFIPPSSPNSDTTPPTSAITSPSEGATVSGAVTVSASASDDVGVRRVELYVDGVLKQTSTTAPYSFAWDTSTVPDGQHWLYVLAWDGSGNYGTTGGTMVTVANSTADSKAPTVSITAPSNGATVSGAVPVSAAASDNVGVTRVDFAVDGTTVASSTSAPYGFTWNASGAGSHTITATAYDAAGNSSTASVSVTVPAPADTTPPTVSFGSPANGATVSGTSSVQVTTSDNVGVASVTLSADGSALGTDTSSPWTFGVDTTKLSNGTHTITAKASDAAGNTATAQETVNVQNGTTTTTGDTKAPSTPSNLKLAVAGTSQAAVFWSPSTDNVGVAGYKVFRDGVQVAQTTLPNYLDIGLTPGSSHTYTVQAFDAAGNTSATSSRLSARAATLSTSTTSTLAGVVYSSAGKPLANIVVTLTGNGLTKTAKTNNTGVYKFSSLPVGVYTITIGTVTSTPAGAAATTTTDTVTTGTSVTTVAGQTVVVVASS